MHISTLLECILTFSLSPLSCASAKPHAIKYTSAMMLYLFTVLTAILPLFTNRYRY